jgi:hypothetical protein
MQRVVKMLMVLVVLSVGAFAACSAPGPWMVTSAPGIGLQATTSHTPASGCSSTITSVSGSYQNTSGSTDAAEALQFQFCPDTNCQFRTTGYWYLSATVGSTDHVTVHPSVSGILGASILKFLNPTSGVYEAVTITGQDQ